MDQMIGNGGKQGWNGSGNDNQNNDSFQQISQTKRLNQYQDRKRKYQEFYGKNQNFETVDRRNSQVQTKNQTTAPNQSNSETITLPTNPERFLHVESSKYTRTQKGDLIFTQSKERYGGNGSPVEGKVGHVSKTLHTRYPTPKTSVSGNSKQGREGGKGEVVESQAQLVSRRVGEVNRSLPADKPESTITNQIQNIPVNSQGEGQNHRSPLEEKTQPQTETKHQQSIETKKPLIQPYFQEGNHCLYQADCVEVMKQFPDNYVDMIFADPPYFLSEPDEAREVTNFPVKDLKFKNGENKGGYDNYKGEWDVSRGFRSNLQFQHNWIKEARRILKPEGTIWITGTHHSIYQCGFCLQNQQFKILNEISWYKPKSKYNPKNYFNFSHETIIWARKSQQNQHRHYFNTSLMSKWRGDPLKDSNPENPQSMRTVWQIHPPTKKETVHGRHPTQKSIQLLQRIILASTKPDAIILDPFNGSGTTGVAIETINRGLKRAGKWDKNTKGRRYIGIDRESEYLEVTKRRLGGGRFRKANQC